MVRALAGPHSTPEHPSRRGAHALHCTLIDLLTVGSCKAASASKTRELLAAVLPRAHPSLPASINWPFTAGVVTLNPIASPGHQRPQPDAAQPLGAWLQPARLASQQAASGANASRLPAGLNYILKPTRLPGQRSLLC